MWNSRKEQVDAAEKAHAVYVDDSTKVLLEDQGIKLLHRS
jgi:hypothetical protein